MGNNQSYHMHYFESYEAYVNILDYIIVPDEKEIIIEKLKKYSAQKLNLIIFAGRTLLSPRE
jgi:molybdopterin biosynthesis enzyme MoaB